MKITAIYYWSHVVVEFDEMLAPLQLLGIVLRAEGNVMHRSSRNVSEAAIWDTKQVNDSTGRRAVGRDKPKPVSRLLDQTITETVGEQSRGLFVTFERGGNAVKTMKRVLWQNGPDRPRLNASWRLRNAHP